VDRIAKITGESAAGAQQSAKACQDLSGLAFDLQSMVSGFKIQDGKETSSHQRPAPSARHAETVPDAGHEFVPVFHSEHEHAAAIQ